MRKIEDGLKVGDIIELHEKKREVVGTVFLSIVLLASENEEEPGYYEYTLKNLVRQGAFLIEEAKEEKIEPRPTTDEEIIDLDDFLKVGEQYIIANKNYNPYKFIKTIPDNFSQLYMFVNKENEINLIYYHELRNIKKHEEEKEKAVGLKFQVRNEAESETLQQILFSAGCKFEVGGQNIRSFCAPFPYFLLVTSEKIISASANSFVTGGYKELPTSKIFEAVEEIKKELGGLKDD